MNDTKYWKSNLPAYVNGRKKNHTADRENLRCLSEASSQILGQTNDF